MDATLLSLFAGLISGTITAVITYLATVSKVRLDLTVEYDKELHNERLRVYKLLWPKLKPIARYSRENPITYQVIKDTSEQMRDWYYDTGGIYLSAKSRGPYFSLKEMMQKMIDEIEDKNLDFNKKVKERLEPMMDAARKLRASLSSDIGSRRKSFV